MTDARLSPEEIERLGFVRPLWNFCNCKKPVRKNPSGACGCNECTLCGGKISCVSSITYTHPSDGNYTENIKSNMKSKETYISPFTGKVT